MFRLIPEKTQIPFMSWRKPSIFISLLLSLLAIYFLAAKGLNYGVDFAGGMQVVVVFPEETEVNTESLRAHLDEYGLSQLSVQQFGTEFEDRKKEYLFHFSSEFAQDEAGKSLVNEAFLEHYPERSELVTNFSYSGLERAYVSFREELSEEEVENVIGDLRFGVLEVSEVTRFGREEDNEYEIDFRSVTAALIDRWEERFPSPEGEEIRIEKVDFVGARVGSDLKQAAVISILLTILLVFVYIFMRFDFAYAPGVIVALGHDLLIVTGLFALLGLSFDLTVVAALLTIAGYSINDTIVVYDRVREVSAQYTGKAFSSILDIAINQTLSRTVITSGTTLAATATLWILGGPVIHNFAFALTAGVIVGTYSSVFIAGVFVLWVQEWMKKREAGQKKKSAAA